MKKIKKHKKSDRKHFIIEINADIEREVDEALKFLEKGNIDHCAIILQRLMAKHSSYHAVQYGMGLVYAFKEQYDNAIHYFKRAIDIFPYFLEAQFNLAVSYKKKLDVGNAIRAFKKVVEMGAPGNEFVMQARGFLSGMEESVRKNHGVGLDAYLRGMDNFEKAVADMEKAKWDAAIAGFKECLSIVKRHFQSYGNMGICYAQIGKRQQALAAFDKALEINPGYELAAVNRAVTLGLEEGERLSDGPVESIDYSKDYAAKKRSYIAELIKSIKDA